MAYKTITETYKDSNGEDSKVMIMTFGAREGIKIQAKLLRIMVKFGLGFFSVMGSNKDKKEELKKNSKELNNIMDKDIDFSNIDINEIAALLISELGEDDVVKIINRLLSTTSVDGKPMSDNNIFDETFAGEYGLLFEILKKVLEVNFQSFLANGAIGKILSSVKQAPAMKKLQS